MGLVELLLIAVGLSLDAFAVSVCKGMASSRFSWKTAITAGLYFGVFQAAMPLLGYYLGSSFAQMIAAYDHWVAFALLALIGVKMIWESRDTGDSKAAGIGIKIMLPMAIATSIDALAVGVSFAMLKVNIIEAAAAIGAVTFSLSVVGVKVGQVFGAKFKSRAELAGGVILVLMGLKILFDI